MLTTFFVLGPWNPRHASETTTSAAELELPSPTLSLSLTSDNPNTKERKCSLCRFWWLHQVNLHMEALVLLKPVGERNAPLLLILPAWLQIPKLQLNQPASPVHLQLSLWTCGVLHCTSAVSFLSWPGGFETPAVQRHLLKLGTVPSQLPRLPSSVHTKALPSGVEAKSRPTCFLASGEFGAPGTGTCHPWLRELVTKLRWDGILLLALGWRRIFICLGRRRRRHIPFFAESREVQTCLCGRARHGEGPVGDGDGRLPSDRHSDPQAHSTCSLYEKARRSSFVSEALSRTGKERLTRRNLCVDHWPDLAPSLVPTRPRPPHANHQPAQVSPTPAFHGSELVFFPLGGKVTLSTTGE